MRKLLGIIILGLLFSTNVQAAKVKVKEKEPNYIIIKEKRPVNIDSTADPILLDGVAEIVNNYCSSKNLIGFYILAKLNPNVSDGFTDGRTYGYVMQDGKGGVFYKNKRYFCAKTPEHALKLFHSDKKIKSHIKIYPGFMNAYNGYLIKREQILGDYYVKTTSPVYAKKLEDEKRRKEAERQRIAEKKKKKLESKKVISGSAKNKFYYDVLICHIEGIYIGIDNNYKKKEFIGGRVFVILDDGSGFCPKGSKQYNYQNGINYLKEWAIANYGKDYLICFEKDRGIFIFSNSCLSNWSTYEKVFFDKKGFYSKNNSFAKNENKNKPVKKKPTKKVVKAPDVDPSLITIGSGSGFYINGEGYALTNNHVVSICRQNISIINGKEILFRVIATDKANDIALIKANLVSRDYVRINKDGGKLGENIMAIGYPLAGRLSDSVKITRGVISSLSGIENNISQIQIDAALQPGNSGGPVLNEKGSLVGIASAGLNKMLMAKEAKYIPENVNFAVASPVVLNFLKSKKVSYSNQSFFSGSYSTTELAELGEKTTIQLFCRNTRTAYAKLKKSKKYSQILLDID